MRHPQLCQHKSHNAVDVAVGVVAVRRPINTTVKATANAITISSVVVVFARP